MLLVLLDVQDVVRKVSQSNQALYFLSEFGFLKPFKSLRHVALKDHFLLSGKQFISVKLVDKKASLNRVLRVQKFFLDEAIKVLRNPIKGFLNHIWLEVVSGEQTFDVKQAKNSVVRVSSFADLRFLELKKPVRHYRQVLLQRSSEHLDFLLAQSLSKLRVENRVQDSFVSVLIHVVISFVRELHQLDRRG